jgi:hypothetical protein
MAIFQQLDESLVLAVLNWLDTQSIVSCLCSNKALYANQTLWRMVCAKRSSLSYEQVPPCEDYRQLCRQLQFRPRMTIQLEDSGFEVEPLVYDTTEMETIWGPECLALCFQQSLIKATEEFLARCPLFFYIVTRQPTGAFKFTQTQCVYYEVTILTENIVRQVNETAISVGFKVGLSDNNTFRTRHRHVGWDRNSFGIHSDDGQLFIASSGVPGIIDKVPLERGDIVGVGCNIYAERLFVTLNGRKLVDCPILDYPSADDLNFFPVVGMDKMTKCRVNFGDLPFAYDLEHEAPADLLVSKRDRCILDRRMGVRQFIELNEIFNWEDDSSAEDYEGPPSWSNSDSDTEFSKSESDTN